MKFFHGDRIFGRGVWVSLVFFFLWGVAQGQAADAKKPSAGGALGAGPSNEKLLSTLNEALKENRKMRQEMQELRAASEKLLMERNEVARQVQQIQQVVSYKDREMGQKVAAANEQAAAARKELEELKKNSGDAVNNRQGLEKKLAELEKANQEMAKLLENTVGKTGPPSAEALAQRDEEAVKKAVTLVSGLNVENVELKERLVGSYFDLGNIYYDLGRYPQAIAQYKRALSLNPYLAWAHHNLAVIYDYRLGEMKEAKYHYQQYLNLKPSGEKANEVQMRLWDVQQLSRLEPGEPLKSDFKRTQKQ